MNKVFALYDLSCSLVLIFQQPMLSILVSTLFGVIVYNARLELTVVSMSFLIAFAIKVESKEQLSAQQMVKTGIGLLFTQYLYTVNVPAAIISQLITDYSTFEQSVYQSKTYARFITIIPCYILSPSNTTDQVALCMLLTCVYYGFSWLKRIKNLIF